MYAPTFHGIIEPLSAAGEADKSPPQTPMQPKLERETPVRPNKEDTSEAPPSCPNPLSTANAMLNTIPGILEDVADAEQVPLFIASTALAEEADIIIPIVIGILAFVLMYYAFSGSESKTSA